MKGVQTAREGGKEGKRGEVGGKPRRLLLWRRVSAILSTVLAQGAEKGEVSGDFLPKRFVWETAHCGLCL